jgi:CRP-like cAMP-binding protein
MPLAVIRKLEHGAPLDAAEKLAIEAVLLSTKAVAAHEDLIQEGERPNYVHVVMEGFAYRYKTLPDGGRQIMAWLLPGDFCDLHIAILGQMDHSIATLADSTIAYVPRATVEELLSSSSAITRAFWWVTLVDEAVLREWLVAMGRQPAGRRIAHLFCEILVRLQAVGMALDGAIDLPLTQAELADTVGLSSVHVNRVIQHLRRDGLIAWRGGTLTIKDIEGLKTFAGFDPGYLHLAARRP